MEPTLYRVRPAAPEDLAAVNTIYNHYVATSHATFDVEPVALGWRRNWFEAHRSGRHRVVVAEGAGIIAGFASSGSYRPKEAYETTVETSVYLEPDAVGRGIGAALYEALFDLLRTEDVHRAVAGIALPNQPSVTLHRRFGFRRVARFTEQGRKFGRYWDVDWYERPVEPIPSGRPRRREQGPPGSPAP